MKSGCVVCCLTRWLVMVGTSGAMIVVVGGRCAVHLSETLCVEGLDSAKVLACECC